MKSIMIVDDVVLMRFMMWNIFESLGFQVVAEAETGQEAVKKYRMFRPSLVVMDISMPEMDGLSAVKKIMEIDRDAKIIICSAFVQREIVLKAIQAGASDFIAKPVQRERMEWSVRKVMGM
ncbi:response regulator [Brevibacillus borstelensis]|uniref:response regulator n=1 Tax=Brevibacillus borstelensis TaxID=45462 RepID=UPI0030BC68E2